MVVVFPLQGLAELKKRTKLAATLHTWGQIFNTCHNGLNPRFIEYDVNLESLTIVIIIHGSPSCGKCALESVLWKVRCGNRVICIERCFVRDHLVHFAIMIAWNHEKGIIIERLCFEESKNEK